MNLNRSALALQTPRENLVHIGIGAFFRAHQAWYTQVAEPNGEWGYVAFTGRSAAVADELSAQDGLYTLVTRSSNADSFQVINSLARVEDGNELQKLTDALVNPDTAVVTLTITEAGYCLTPENRLAESEALLASLRAGEPDIALTRLAWALNQRRLENGLGLALVPCDNIPSNGALLREALSQLFEAFGQEAQIWLAEKVGFVSTSIDRITPKTTDEDVETVKELTGFTDRSPVVTEPFRDWVLEGPFPLGRPSWELAGARFVAEIEPFENRKLWLLNGSHSLLAYLGHLRGHQTVDQAIGDPQCLAAVEAFWDEAERTLANPELQISEYRQALLERFRNRRIAHQLSQIAIDGATKVRVRAMPTIKAERASGRSGEGAIGVVAAWVAFVLSNDSIVDAQLPAILLAKSAATAEARITGLVKLLDSKLAADANFVAQLNLQINNLLKSMKEN